MSQEKIISLILLHYKRNLEKYRSKKIYVSFCVNLIHFLETAYKFAITTSLRVETNTNFTGNNSNISKFSYALLVFSCIEHYFK